MKNLNHSIRKLFFSTRCTLCGKDSKEKDFSYLCDTCYNKILEDTRLNKRGNIYYLTLYNKRFKRIITSMKLRNRRYISGFLGELSRRYLKEVISKEKIDTVVVVPISRSKKRVRGYNQVEEILKYAGIEYRVIKRVKDTKPMHTLLDRKLREENVLGSFKSQIAVEDKNILIVDDIVTTGSTVKEIIKTLRLSGNPKNIIVFTLALSYTGLKSNLSFKEE